MTERQFQIANRLKGLPPYLFAELDRLKQAEIDKGVDVIPLGIGDPDQPTPQNILDAMHRAIDRPENHQYPSYQGMSSFREAVAGWYARRFNVSLDPACEILSLIGSKEGIGHIPFAFINPGDVVLVPEPGYPVYEIATLLAGGEPYRMPLLRENGFLPDLDRIPSEITERARLLFLNYPNNPTAAVASRSFFEKVVRFAREREIIVCHDAAYTEMYYDGKRPLGFLEVEGAKDVGVEFHSLSKTYNMTGWRIGFVCGAAPVIAGLGKIKTNLDSGIFQAVQEAGIEALGGDQSAVEGMRNLYQERRDTLIAGLRQSGLTCDPPTATFYLWLPVPSGHNSTSFTKLLLEKAGVAVTPGNGFGPSGEGYVRFALTVSKERLAEAAERIRKIL
ncbi:MAG: LL-diaminopimelate aminotransferase [Deltaproteobacteria bacterium]|nr:LL-diaminopimelate aminotransferase [Deltaproteobacteria bacterium]